jgi:hypothetical protein
VTRRFQQLPNIGVLNRGGIATSSEDLLPQFHMCKFGQISGSIRHTFDLWTLILFDAGRAKGHFESRQRSTCRPDSPSSNLCASTADSDGVRNVRRHDRWRPPLDRKLPSWSRVSMGHVGPWSVRLAQEPIVLRCASSLQSSLQGVPFMQPF